MSRVAQRSVSRGPRRRRPNRGRSEDHDNENNKSTSPVPSPGAWNVDRGRSRVRRPSTDPFSEDNLRRRGYHTLSSAFGKVFHVEKRWKLVRDMGSGAYGVVISASDDISGETVAIKMVTRVFEKVQLAKRALREITLLRHFANHENITGLIDVDAITPDFNEIYIFMEPMEADLHQIIKSGQVLTNEHVQYFLYQILRGMKFIHSAGVIHRDLKPGNLLVNADCELKICDFGLSRGFEANPDDEYATKLTEYVATRWYRAPEIMLAFPRYNTAIDVWSIGCILGELLLGKPLFKGKDYVDQLNKILDVLGSPSEIIMRKIGSDKAQAYVRSLPFRRPVPFHRLLPGSDPQALDLLAKMLAFDPDDRISVPQALQHPWLSAYHDVSDEPECPDKFERWKEIEKLQTLEEFRTALWDEIESYRREVRGIKLEAIPKLEALGRIPSATPSLPPPPKKERPPTPVAVSEDTAPVEAADDLVLEEAPATEETLVPSATEPSVVAPGQSTNRPSAIIPTKEIEYAKVFDSPDTYRSPQGTADPVVTYARRSSILQSRQGSTFNSPLPSNHLPAFIQGQLSSLTAMGNPLAAGDTGAHHGPGSVVFPTQPGYVVPARSRTGSTVQAAGGDVTRRLLRTLSTVSIHETGQGRRGGLADVAPIGRWIVGDGGTEADAPASEMPSALVDKGDEGDENQFGDGDGDGDGVRIGAGGENQGKKEKRKEKAALFHVE